LLLPDKLHWQYYCENWAKKVVELQKKNIEEYLKLLVKTEEENFVI